MLPGIALKMLAIPAGKGSIFLRISEKNNKKIMDTAASAIRVDLSL